MSTALAIASVTAVLRDLLDNGMIDDSVVSAVGNVTVSARAPDLIALDTNAAGQLNLFLYQVTPNQGWSNTGLPTRDVDGRRVASHPLALDLHYVLTAYASRDLHAEILLGHGMQLLHETPVLSRAAIRRTLGGQHLLDSQPLQPPLPSELTKLVTSGLADQAEAIKIVLHALGAEEISKLWSAFQSRYRPSAYYLVSVVLIEAHRPLRTPLPVRARGLYVVPFSEPVIDAVLARLPTSPSSAPRADVPILAHHAIVLRGRRLRGERTSVRIGGIIVAPAAVTDDEITVALPDGLQAGVQSVQVVHEHLMGDPPVPHPGVSSNLAAFVLRPEIVAPPTLPVTHVVRVAFSPPVSSRQHVALMLNEWRPPESPPDPTTSPPRAYTFPAPPAPTGSPDGPATQLDVPIPGVAPGIFLVRLAVDGAESPLGSDASGRFDSPRLTIP